MEKIRLQKIIAAEGICSRRKAEELIKSGKVKLNGKTAEVGDSATARDIITVDGQVLRRLKKKNKLYIMMYKPRGYVTTMSDELGRKNVTDLLGETTERVYPVGRLDKDSEGLLLFTNDGDFANGIMHPSKHITKVYRVTVDSAVTEEQLALLTLPMEIDGKMTQQSYVEVLTEQKGRTVLKIAIHEGKNRQIRKMCETAGLQVGRLKRTSIGGVKLGMLKPGAFRELTPEELRSLRSLIG
ncbi:MAG: rRNA pseudouridine synthase [Ruminococcus sp.]|jgi:23S rRNA pseudouridine2605 synthase|nr:rRNA pseudouridine synthase [Ruminococcus sp.]